MSLKATSICVRLIFPITESSTASHGRLKYERYQRHLKKDCEFMCHDISSKDM
jgi:hypothetical protein